MGAITLTLTSDGTKLDSTIGVISVEVRRELNRVPEAHLRIVDGSIAQRKFAVSDASAFEPGKKIAIAVRDGDRPDATIFEGLVTQHAVESRSGESQLRVELKDAAFALTRQRKSAVFRKQADDAAIRKLVTDAKLKAGTIEATKTTHDELIQFRASDWDFLVSRADASGLVVDVERGTVSVQAMVASGAAVLTLAHGIDDVELDLELEGGEQYAAMTSTAWDVAKLAPTAVTDAADPGVTVGNLDSSAVANKLGGDTYALVHPAILASGELTAWAGSRLARSRLAMLRGTATIPGSTAVKPRDLVAIEGVGDRFNGKAYVSGITHTIDGAGWRTELQLGLPAEPFAKQPDIADLPAGGLVPGVTGLHVGVVGDYEEDPLGEHRVKVLLSVLDKKQGAVWARVAKPDAGKDRGAVFWPEVGDEVVVGFVNGDPRQAVMLGALHGSKNAPPATGGPPSKDNKLRTIATKSGIVIAFDDDKKVVTIKTPGGNQVVLDDDNKAITLADVNKNQIVMDASGIKITTDKDFKIEAKGNVTIKGTAVDVQ